MGTTDNLAKYWVSTITGQSLVNLEVSGHQDMIAANVTITYRYAHGYPKKIIALLWVPNYTA